MVPSANGVLYGELPVWWEVGGWLKYLSGWIIIMEDSKPHVIVVYCGNEYGQNCSFVYSK